MALLSMIQDNNGVGGLNCKLNEFRCHTADQNIGDLHFVFSTIETDDSLYGAGSPRLPIILSRHVRWSKIVFNSGFFALDSGLQVLDSGLILSETWIPDSNCYLESAVLQLYSGFQSPGDQIPRAKISRIPESALRGTTSTKKKQPFQTSLQSQEGGTVNTFQIKVTIVNLFCCRTFPAPNCKVYWVRLTKSTASGSGFIKFLNFQ